MGQTISDLHKTMYSNWLNQGLSHEQAINNVPERLRERFIKDINMSSIESHFGMKNHWFLIMIIVVIIGTIIFANVIV